MGIAVKTNHHDNHKHTHSHPPHVFLRHAQTRRCRFPVHVKVTPHGAPASMEEKKRRGGRSYRCDAPTPRCAPEEWSRGRARTPPHPPTPLLRNGNESDGSVQPSATTTRLLPVGKKKSRDAATMATWE